MEEQDYDAWFRPAIDPLLGAGCISIPNKLDLLTTRREMNDGRQGGACYRDSGMSPRYSLKYDFFFLPEMEVLEAWQEFRTLASGLDIAKSTVSPAPILGPHHSRYQFVHVPL